MPAFRKSLVSFLKNIGWLSKKKKTKRIRRDDDKIGIFVNSELLP